MKNFCLFMFFWVLINNTAVLGQKFRYTTYRGEEVPFIKVNQAIQDVHKYIWLATDQGLFRFDGATFQDFNIELRSRYIRSIIPWKNDTLLFSNDIGVFKLFYESNRPKITSYLARTEEQKEMTYPGRLFKDSKDRLWIGQGNGSVLLKRSSKDKGQVINVVLDHKTPKIFFGEDQFQTLWILIPKYGLFYFNESLNMFKPIGNFINTSHFYVDGDKIWLAGEQLSKLEVDKTHQILNREQIENNNISFDYINKDLAGTFFIASQDEIFTLDASQSYRLKKVFGSNDPHRVENLSYNQVNDIYFSKNQVRPGGAVWISTSKGIGLLWSSYFQSVSGMSHDNVFSISSCDNNEVLISQNDVNRVTNIGDSIDFEQLEGMNKVTGISSFEDKTWYGNADGIIVEYNKEVVKKRYDLKNRGGGVFYMFADHKGNNWFCQAPTDKPIVGVAKINLDGELVIYDESKGLNNRILVVSEGGHSELYAAGIGVESYLYKYDQSQDIFKNHSLPFPFKVSGNFEVHDLAIDKNGIVWLGTTDGLLKYDTERILRINLGPFTKNEIRSVCTISEGGLWLATDTNGLIYLDAKGESVFFDEKSGTPSKVTSYRSMIIDSNDHLWVGTAEGAVYSFQSNPKPLAMETPVLSQILVDNKTVETTSQSFSEASLLSFGFASITFPATDVRYQYKIFDTNIYEDEIVDIPWSNSLEDNFIRLQGLKGGEYSLWVRAQKPGGYSWSLPQKIDFEIRKIWYKTFWSTLLFLVIGMMSLWYFLRLWVFKKTKDLEATLFLQQKELHKKEEALISQSKTLEFQKEKLKTAGTNIYLLYRLLRQIPNETTWNEVLPILKKLVELPTGVNAFEVAFKKGDEMCYRGSSRKHPNLKDRSEEFNEKENLATYVMVGNKPLLVHDYNEEVGQFINKKDSEYQSQILMPFEQKNNVEVILCIYGKEKNKFTQRDLTLIQILARFLSISIIDEL